MEETPGNELPAEELQQQTAIALEMKQLSPSPGKVSRMLKLIHVRDALAARGSPAGQEKIYAAAAEALRRISEDAYS
ncbi:hypothetical protein LAZ67_21001568 [Cordylochernes scorpioides]|uniref:Uncharacterized protein n=1 Tax=Cordylochernes scorpioides TaxID=51811 RepID=A0ABY6LRD0_9ARAC|nr:hypothetical protein LAZ67_21001568 [Cordylochernes scorpioides]